MSRYSYVNWGRRETEGKESRRGRKWGRGRWEGLRRYGEQDRRNWEGEETKEELPFMTVIKLG